MSAFRSFPVVVLFSIAACCGCGPAQEQFWPVSGTVTLDDKPLTFGSVSFRPDAARGNASLHNPIGTIDPQGRYTLITVNRAGAPPGWYKVLVFADENLQPGGTAHPAMPRWLVPVQYTSEKSTPLSVEVVAAPGQGAYDLRLKK